MIKDIVEKYKEHYSRFLSLEDVQSNSLQILEDVIIDFEKEVERQEEMLNALIALLKRYDKNYLTTYFENGEKYTMKDLYEKGDLCVELTNMIELIEKATGMKWNEINT